LREVDFLPTWYPAFRRRRTLLAVQVWLTIALVVAAAGGLFWQRQRLGVARATLHDDEARLAQVRREVRQLDELEGLQRELLQKRRLVARLGVPVDLTRVVAELAECMGPAVSLSDLTAKTNETGKSMAELAAERRGGRGGAAGAAGGISRTLRVSLKGVAPTESDVTAFYARLADRRFFDDVRLEHSAERRDQAHVMREFDLSFAIPLDYDPAETDAAVAGARD